MKHEKSILFGIVVSTYVVSGIIFEKAVLEGMPPNIMAGTITFILGIGIFALIHYVFEGKLEFIDNLFELITG